MSQAISMFRMPLLALVAGLAVAGCAKKAPLPNSAADLGINANNGAQPGTPQDFTVNVGDRILFDTDSAVIRSDAQSILSRQAQWLNQNQGVNAQIAGHADERGTREFNLALGARRAEAIRAFLVSQGVAAGRLSTVSFGKERPAGPCSAETCWSQNRRSVTGLIGAPTS